MDQSTESPQVATANAAVNSFSSELSSLWLQTGLAWSSKYSYANEKSSLYSIHSFYLYVDLQENNLIVLNKIDALALGSPAI